MLIRNCVSPPPENYINLVSDDSSFASSDDESERDEDLEPLCESNSYEDYIKGPESEPSSVRLDAPNTNQKESDSATHLLSASHPTSHEPYEFNTYIMSIPNSGTMAAAPATNSESTTPTESTNT